MQQTRFTLPPMSKVDLTVNYVELEGHSPLNQNEPHIHKACEIYVNLSGDVSFEVENRIYPISRGSVIITRPYEYHHCIQHSAECHRHYWITFSAAEQDEFLKLFFNRKKGTNNLIILNEEQLGECCRVLSELFSVETDTISRNIGFLQLLRILLSSKGETASEATEHFPRDVLQALRFMDEHLTEDYDAQRLANAANVSGSTLDRHFKEVLGLTPFAMLRKKRLILSTEQLRNGKPSPKRPC